MVMEIIDRTMKQYTNEAQTVKLLELGFEMPRAIKSSTLETSEPYTFSIVREHAYSIGEMLEIIPNSIIDNITGSTTMLQMTCFEGTWRVKYAGARDMVLMMGFELIDALYDMVRWLHENGYIGNESDSSKQAYQ